MHILKIVLEIIVVIASILLTLLILMHKGKGGGLSDMFGGGLTQNAGTSGVAEKNLNRWTIFIALVWVAIIIALGLMTNSTWCERDSLKHCMQHVEPWSLDHGSFHWATFIGYRLRSI